MNPTKVKAHGQLLGSLIMLIVNYLLHICEKWNWKKKLKEIKTKILKCRYAGFKAKILKPCFPFWHFVVRENREQFQMAFPNKLRKSKKAVSISFGKFYN